MKKNYTKPMLLLEPMVLTQPITRDCAESIPESQVTANDPANCVWDLGGGATVFVSGSDCAIDGERMGFYCYNNPTEGNYIFRS